MFTDNSLKAVRSYFFDHLQDQFERKEIDNFLLWTLEDRFELNKTDLLLNEKRFSESELLQFRDVVDRLAENEPIQYILGNAHFLGKSFKVGPGVLIPRPETEELVSLILKDHQEGKVLDIGTGSGIIPITLKLHAPQMETSGVDVSEVALSYAKENGERYGVSVQWLHQDVLSKALPETYDLIISNPPYVRSSEKDMMESNVLDFEPHEALFVSDDKALVFYERILELSKDHLRSGGWIYFEINEFKAEEMKALVHEFNFHKVQIFQDLQGKSRMLRAQKKESQKL